MSWLKTLTVADIERHNQRIRVGGMVAKVKKNENQNNRKISNAKPEQNQAAALGGAIQREAKGVQRTIVRFVGHRVRPLDPDNFAGSVKDLLDGLRHANLISGDDPWRIKLETEQVQVNHYDEERTEIEIEK